jgi:hypothetical protein
VSDLGVDVPSSNADGDDSPRSSRTLGLTALTAAAGVVVGLATVLPADSPEAWARALADQKARGWTSVLAFGVAEVAGAAALALLAETVAARRRGRARVGALIAGLGFLANLVMTLSAYAVATTRASDAASGDVGALATMTTARTTVDLADAVNVGLLGVGLLVLVSVVKAPRWHAVLGMLAGVTGVVGALEAVSPAFVPIRLVSGVLYLVWIASTAVRALRRQPLPSRAARSAR